MNAESTQKISEAYNSDKLSYPDTKNELLGGSSATPLPTGILLLDGNTETLSSTNGLKTVWYQYDGPAGSATGGRIRYWDFNADKLADEVLYVGDATLNSTFTDLN